MATYALLQTIAIAATLLLTVCDAKLAVFAAIIER